MKIKSIEYGESVQTSYDTWKKLSLTAELEEGDVEEEAIQKIQSRVSEFMKKQTEIVSAYQYKKSINGRDDATPIKSLTEEMEGCNTYEEIQSFRLTVKTEEEKAVYERMITKLSHKNQ